MLKNNFKSHICFSRKVNLKIVAIIPGCQWLTPIILATQEADQEDSSSKPTQANSLRDPISKKTHHKERASGMAQGVGPELKPQYCKKNVF
jgi:hypothetical protein